MPADDGPEGNKAGVKSAGLANLLTGLTVTLVVFVLMDLAVGFVFLGENMFRGYPVPPYDLTFTDAQRAHLGPNPPPANYAQFDPDLGWSIRADGKSKDGMLQANAAGFRAQREYALTPPEGVLRVATFGDSFTHSDEVSNEESWAHLLESMGSHREVLNFGVGGYGTDQAFLRYRRDGSRFQPDAVVIGFLLENILRNVSVYRPAYYHETGNISVKPRFIVNESGALTLLPPPVKSREELVSAVRSRSLLPVLKATDYWVQRAPLAYDDSPLFWSALARIAYSVRENSGRGYGDIYFQDPGSEPFRVTSAIIKSFNDSAKADGVERVIVLIIPPKDVLARLLAGGDRYWESLTSFLDESGIAYVDVTEPLLEAARRDGLDELFVYFHFSKAGNDVVARALDKALFNQR